MQSDFIPTRGSLIKGIISTEKTHSFNSHKSKRKLKNTIHQELDSTKKNEFNIKQAKREIIKFGVSGLDKHKKEEYKVQLAIKLGAIPPKNKCKNYAVLQQEKKRERMNDSKPVLQHLGKVTLPKANVKKRNDYKRSKRKSSSIIENYGMINNKPN